MIATLTIAAYTFNVTPYQMALISAAGLLPGIVLSKTIGRLVEKRSPVLIVRASLVLRVISTIFIIYSNNLILFTAAIALRSIFSSCTLPAINSLANTNVSSDDRSAYFSTLSLINGLCKIIAPVLGGMLSELGSPYVPLVISSALGLMAIPFFSRAMSTASSNADSMAMETPELHSGSTSEGVIFFACLAIFFSFVFMVNNLLPLILKILNYDPSMLGVLVGAAGTGNVLMSFYLLKRSSAPAGQATIQSMIFPAIGTAFCFMLIGVLIGKEGSINNLLLIISFLAIGLFSATFSIATNHVLFKIFSARIGSATANLQAVQNIAILLSPLVGAFILDHASPRFLFLVSSAAAVIALLVAYVAAPGRSAADVRLSE